MAIYVFLLDNFNLFVNLLDFFIFPIAIICILRYIKLTLENERGSLMKKTAQVVIIINKQDFTN